MLGGAARARQSFRSAAALSPRRATSRGSTGAGVRKGGRFRRWGEVTFARGDSRRPRGLACRRGPSRGPAVSTEWVNYGLRTSGDGEKNTNWFQGIFRKGFSVAKKDGGKWEMRATAVATVVLLLVAANGADVRRNHAPDGCFDRCARAERCPLPLQCARVLSVRVCIARPHRQASRQASCTSQLWVRLLRETQSTRTTGRRLLQPQRACTRHAGRAHEGPFTPDPATIRLLLHSQASS